MGAKEKEEEPDDDDEDDEDDEEEDDDEDEEEEEEDGPEKTSSESLKVFVGTIPWSKEEEDAIRKHFGKCGEIAEMDLPNKLAFITFKSAAAVEKALELDGKKFGGGSDGLKVRRAIEKKKEGSKV